MSSVLNHALSIRTTKKHIKNQPQQQRRRQQTALAPKVAAASLNRLFYHHDPKWIRARFFSTNKNKHREAKQNPITKFLNLAPESATAKKSEEKQMACAAGNARKSGAAEDLQAAPLHRAFAIH
jgi:hypothetical protein